MKLWGGSASQWSGQVRNKTIIFFTTGGNRIGLNFITLVSERSGDEELSSDVCACEYSTWVGEGYSFWACDISPGKSCEVTMGKLNRN